MVKGMGGEYRYLRQLRVLLYYFKLKSGTTSNYKSIYTFYLLNTYNIVQINYVIPFSKISGFLSKLLLSIETYIDKYYNLYIRVQVIIFSYI